MIRYYKFLLSVWRLYLRLDKLVYGRLYLKLDKSVIKLVYGRLYLRLDKSVIKLVYVDCHLVGNQSTTLENSNFDFHVDLCHV